MSRSRPIYIIGAGSIVRDAHIPAYRDARYDVGGIFDLDTARVRELAGEAGTRAFTTLEDLIDDCVRHEGVFDLALPPKAVRPTLARLPEDSFALVQKPFGVDLADATALLGLARARRITGVVNFQLRHAPVVREARRLLASGAIGEPVDLEMRVVCKMPWETWPFLRGMPRMEILMHAIHYLDLVRGIMGEPDRVWSAVAGHPDARDIAESRSTTILTFDRAGISTQHAEKRAVVTTYHHHTAPEGHDASHLRIEGTRGTIVARLGVNLDYPRGRPDTLEWSREGGPWQSIPVAGHWFPHAFAGPMTSLQVLAARNANSVEFNAPQNAPQNAPKTLPRVESMFDDAWRTMALVETCYKSASGGERVPELHL